MITSVGDVTSDLLCERLGDEVLRLNWERWREYELEITPSTFRVEDAFGRRVTKETLGNVIWRKPLPDVDRDSGEDWFAFREFKYAVQAIIADVRRTTPERLPIDPLHNGTVDKFHQLRIASAWFRTPRWLVTTRPGRASIWDTPSVVKSSTGEPIPGTGTPAKVVYTSPAEPRSLADGFPWFLQEEITAASDLTVVMVEGQAFSFALERSSFPGIDWRRHIGDGSTPLLWNFVATPDDLRSALGELMSALGLRFGRVDLLGNSPYSLADVTFLEVNPNGQWAWLDPGQDNGLFDAVASYLTHVTGTTPIAGEIRAANSAN